MMWTRIASLKFRILLLQLSLKLASACLEEGPCRELAFPSFLFFANKRLVNHTMKDVQVGDMGECERLCYEEHNCVSINFERKKDGDGKYHCELNNSTHGEHDQDLVDTENYFHRGTKNACSNSPCKNGGTCQSGFTKKRYRCLCPPGFTGGQCQQDINECVENADECDHNAECENTKGSYKCKCKAGYTGNGSKCEDIDECAKNANRCDLYAKCENTNGSYKCKCRTGFTGNGHKCDDIDECSSHKCVANAKCSNTWGSYICICKQGFVGDGRSCTDHCKAVTAATYCGWNGIDKTQCEERKGCCYNGSHCLYPADHKCYGITPDQRVHCNQSGINRQECEDSGCCFDEDDGSCFYGKGKFRRVMMESKILSSNGTYLYHLDDFLAPTVAQNQSHWHLCYRASRDKKVDYIFHEKCDGNNNTVTIIRKDQYVFGGFTDIPWEGCKGPAKHGESSQAFIFSLRNKEDLEPFKVVVKQKKKAILNQKYLGPTFGRNDLRIDRPYNLSFTNFGRVYPAPDAVNDTKTILAGTHNFEPDEVEVFHAV